MAQSIFFMPRQTLGTSACPPYHVALVIGGTSAFSSEAWHLLYIKFAAFQCISKICLNIWCAKHITNGIYRSTDLAFTWGLEKELAFSFAGPCLHQAEACLKTVKLASARHEHLIPTELDPSKSLAFDF